ncbi:hypothetical protein EC991_008220 [Linnemannia zychae]|nr:hypothetical protein EC991_008220 [Linnemannia zychae]
MDSRTGLSTQRNNITMYMQTFPSPNLRWTRLNLPHQRQPPPTPSEERLALQLLTSSSLPLIPAQFSRRPDNTNLSVRPLDVQARLPTSITTINSLSHSSMTGAPSISEEPYPQWYGIPRSFALAESSELRCRHSYSQTSRQYQQAQKQGQGQGQEQPKYRWPSWTEFTTGLLSDVRGHHYQPQQSRLLDGEFEGEGDGDDNSELTRQIIFNNTRSDCDCDDDDYWVDYHRGMHHQNIENTAAVVSEAEVKSQGLDLDNTANSALVTTSLSGGFEDYYDYNEDDEHYASLQSMFYTNHGLYSGFIAPIFETLLALILVSAVSLYTLHLLQKLLQDVYIAEILYCIVVSVHWIWYLGVVWPVRVVGWSLVALWHALKMVDRLTWVTLEIEGFIIAFYFLRRLGKWMMIDGGTMRGGWP